MPATLAVTRAIPAPASRVYEILADYRQHHPHILPDGLGPLDVEQGGVGAGTRIRVGMRVLGQSRTLRMDVTEPAPGRVLQETDLDTGDVTRFTVEPDAGGCRVTIATEWTHKPGLAGWIERTFAPRIARRMYEEELGRLAAYAARVG